jgi:hypothetical protein
MLADRAQNQQNNNNNNVMVNNRGGGGGGQPMPDNRGGGGGGDGGQPGPGPGPDNGGGGNMANFRGNLASVPYPANFRSDAQAMAQIRQQAPFYAFAAVDDQQTTGIDVFEFNSNNAEECLKTLVQMGQQSGYQYTMGQPQQTKIGGQQGMVIPFQGVIQNGGGKFQGALTLVTTQRGILGIGVWGSDGTNEWNNVQQAVIAQTRMGGGK